MPVRTDLIADDDRLIIATTDNIAPALQEAQDQRNNAHYSGRKFKPGQDFHRVALITPSVLVELMNRGCNLLRGSPEDERRFAELMNGEFAYLKTTDARL